MSTTTNNPQQQHLDDSQWEVLEPSSPTSSSPFSPPPAPVSTSSSTSVNRIASPSRPVRIDESLERLWLRLVEMEKSNAYLRIYLTKVSKQITEQGEATQSNLEGIYDACDEQIVGIRKSMSGAYDVTNENIGTLFTQVGAIHSRFDQLVAALEAVAQPNPLTEKTSKQEEISKKEETSKQEVTVKKEVIKPEETSKKEATVKPKETVKPNEIPKQQQVQNKNATIKHKLGRHESRVDALIKKHNGNSIPVLKYLAHEVDITEVFTFILALFQIIGFVWLCVLTINMVS